mmetsp:Transcript_4130/g.15557  ORF Transcript_4130/g.15557 Transcript_4130/m.15557 type:complete len:539 (+) Transcript_4130:199-1815(+)
MASSSRHSLFLTSSMAMPTGSSLDNHDSSPTGHSPLASVKSSLLIAAENGHVGVESAAEGEQMLRPGAHSDRPENASTSTSVVYQQQPLNPSVTYTPYNPTNPPNYQDRVIAFTQQQMQEEFVALEKHWRLEDDAHIESKDNGAKKGVHTKKLTKKQQKVAKKQRHHQHERTNKSPLNPLLLTNEALYKLHPEHYEYTARKPVKPPQTLSAQDAMDWFKEYHRVQFEQRKQGGGTERNSGLHTPASSKQPNPIQTPTHSAASQKVVNDLFSSHIIQPKWRISLYYIESVEEDRQQPGEWLFTCFSDEQRHKDGGGAGGSASGSGASAQAQGKDPVVRVVRRYKTDDAQTATIWVETFRSVLQSFWQRRWEQCLALAEQQLSNRRFSVRGPSLPKSLKSAGSASEFYQHHAWVHKINRKGQEQFRALLFSNHHMYLVNALPGDSLENVPTVRWRLEIGTVLTGLLMYDQDPTVLGILMDKNTAKKQSKKAHASYDFRCASEMARNTHMMEMCRLYHITSGGKSLEIKRVSEGKPSGSSK